MKLSQNSVSAVLFSTREGMRNGNDPKAPMNPDAPDKRRSGFCILREGGGANWNPGADPLRQAKEQLYGGHWQVNHNMLYVLRLFFQLRDCIIPVQNRGDGENSGWNVFGCPIHSQPRDKVVRATYE